MFTYISNGTGAEATRGTRTSSLTLQQHLTHHYRAVTEARPVVDTGQTNRRKDGRRRWRRGADSSETPSAAGSADNQRLLEAILRDKRLPPQYYCRQEATEKDLETSATEDGSLLGGAPERPAAEAILGKIDSYLSHVRANKDSKSLKADRVPSHKPAAAPSKSALGAEKPCRSQQRPPAVAVRSLVSKKRKLLTGDVMERFPQDFTAKRPFRPQVLRTSASPRLRYLRVYRGPMAVPRSSGARGRGRRPANSLGSSSGSARSGSFSSQSQRGRGESQQGTEDEGASEEEDEDEGVHGDEEEEEEEENDEEDEDEEEYGDDFEEEHEGKAEQASSEGVSSRVPPLSISPDSDQEAWLREQASKALTRQRAAHVVKTNYRSPSKDSAYNGGFSSCSRGPTPEEAAAHRPAARGPRVGPTVAPPARPPAARPPQRSGDEQAYVQFLNDVTSDILARGVFTNRILKRVMAAHVDKHRGKLDTARMLSELERLRLQLGIPANDELDEADHGFGCVGNDGETAAAAAPAARPAPPSPLVLEHRPPAFVDSLLFPTGESWEQRGTGDAARQAAPPGGRTAAPPGGRQVAVGSGDHARSSDPPEGMAALLASLSLDESVTQTILNCCRKTADASSVSSEELRECLNWRTPHTDIT